MMLASRQIFPVVSIKWRLQEDWSSLSAEQALIILLLSVSGEAMCDAGLTPDFPVVRSSGDQRRVFVSLVSKTGLKNIPTFSFRSCVV